MTNSTLKNPVVFAKRSDIREAVKSELTKLGATKVIAVSTSDECIHELFQERERILCLDWAVGDKEAVKVLEALRGKFLIETRPVYVLIPEVSDRTVAMACEYGVSRIQSGQVSADEIRNDLRALLKEVSVHIDMNQALVTIAMAREKGEWEESTILLHDMHTKDPDNARVTIELAENLVHEEHWDQAHAALLPLVSSEEPPVRALHLMGRIHLKQGDFDAAIGQLERAKLINPLNVDRLIELGTACLGIDNIERAMENFAMAQKIAPHNELAKEGVGKCHLMQGEVNEALSLLKESSGPRELASIFNTAAILSIRSDRCLKGIALYQAAISATKGDKRVGARLVFNMGLGYRRMAMWDKAHACFTKSIEWDPAYGKAKRNKEFCAIKLVQMGKDPASLVDVPIGISIAEAFGRDAQESHADHDEEEDFIAVGEEGTSGEGDSADLTDFDDDVESA